MGKEHTQEEVQQARDRVCVLADKARKSKEGGLSEPGTPPKGVEGGGEC